MFIITLSGMYLQAYYMSYSCLKYILVPAFEWQTQPMQLWNLPARPNSSLAKLDLAVRAIS